MLEHSTLVILKFKSVRACRVADEVNILPADPALHAGSSWCPAYSACNQALCSGPGKAAEADSSP